MIDFEHEKVVSLDQAAKLLPPNRNGKPVSLSCVFRWIVDGIKTPRGKVRLEGRRVGRRWLTSVEALARFSDALTPDLTRPTPVSRTPSAGRARRRERGRNWSGRGYSPYCI